jgi:hypothetical protein
MARSTVPSPADADALAVRRHAATAHHSLRVGTILDQRSDLQGVLDLADLVHDAARWAA